MQLVRRVGRTGGGVTPNDSQQFHCRTDHTMRASIIFITTILATVSSYDAFTAYREQRSIYSRPNLDILVRKPIGFLAGEPIYPRSYGDDDSREGSNSDSGELVIDENGAVYRMQKRFSMLNILRRKVYI